MRKVILFLFILLVFAIDKADAQYVSVRLWYTTAIDTLIDGIDVDSTTATNISTIYNGRYPDYLLIFARTTDINNGEGLTFRMREQGRLVETNWDALDSLVATVGEAGKRVYDMTLVGNAGEYVDLHWGTYASSAATDTLSFRAEVFGLYKRANE